MHGGELRGALGATLRSAFDDVPSIAPSPLCSRS
jgi:hypothetical protein